MTKPAKKYSLAELESLPTIAVGQADNLKVDSGGDVRIWLSRCTTLDGEPYDNKVTVERLVAGRWVEADCYQAF